jgi:hypothetical protein
MAHKPEEPGSESPRSLSTVEAIRAIAARDARAELDTEEQLTLFLRSWWSKTYNRPLKDPLLLSYTVEELLYEFYDKVERKLAEEERVNNEADKIEDDKEKAVLDWAEEEERKELAALKAEAAKQDPTKDPANIEWMKKQLAEAKAIHGEMFGEDLSVGFED